MFQRTDDIKYDIEDLFMNIEGGELARKNKLDGDWSLKETLINFKYSLGVVVYVEVVEVCLIWYI